MNDLFIETTATEATLLLTELFAHAPIILGMFMFTRTISPIPFQSVLNELLMLPVAGLSNLCSLKMLLSVGICIQDDSTLPNRFSLHTDYPMPDLLQAPDHNAPSGLVCIDQIS